jgi:hypothetical protein
MFSLVSKASKKLTVTKRDQRPQYVKDDSSVDNSIHVELPEVLDGRYTSLIVLEDVLLHRVNILLKDKAESRASIPTRMSSMTWSMTAMVKSGW